VQFLEPVEGTPVPRLTLPATAAAAILAAHVGLVVWAARTNFVVVDEAGLLATGMTHWETDKYFAYRVNPPLPRMLAALPMWIAGAKVDYTHFIDGPAYRCEIPLGQDFAVANRDRYLDLVFLARLTGVGWSVLGGVVVSLWTRELSGTRGALVALALWAFNPTVIALAALVEPDLPAAVAGLVATYAFWCYLRRPSWAAAWFAGLLLGLALLTKFTLLILYPVWAVLWLVAWRSAREPDRQRPGARGMLHGALIAVASVLVINLGYGFAGSGRQLRDYAFVSKTFAGSGPRDPSDGSGNRFRATPVESLPVPVPADYLRGSILNGGTSRLGGCHTSAGNGGTAGGGTTTCTAWA
jgi:Dolichyl-phosphate-mannose-protein mannosyltransferase